MNFQDLNFDSADQQPSQAPQFWSPRTLSDQSQATPRPDDAARPSDDLDLTSDSGHQPSSLFAHPAPVVFAPTPPWDTTSTLSHPDQYSYQRVFGYPFIDNRPPGRQAPASGPTVTSNPTVTLNEARGAMDEVATRAEARGFRDELTVDANGSVTPGYDEGPFFGFALDALTAERWPNQSPASSFPARSDLTAQGIRYELPDDYYDFEDGLLDGSRGVANPNLGVFSPPTALPTALTRDSVHPLPKPETPPETPRRTPWKSLLAYNTTPPLTPVDPSRLGLSQENRPEDGTSSKLYPISEAVPHTRDGKTRLDGLDPSRQKYPRIDYLPRLLRLLPIMTLMILCLLMVMLLIMSTVISLQQPGLLDFGNGLHNGGYFLFRIFPQLLAAGIFVYAQCIMTTSIRILPFASMADDIADGRREAIFQGMYPKSFLIPHLTGSPAIKFCQVSFWLAGALAIPLSSSTFTVIRVDGQWRWTSVQPVTWIVVVLYLLLAAAAATLARFWHGRHTGLMWDPRSIADMALMLYKTNTLDDYKGTEMLEDKKYIRSRLYRHHMDRLGYWQSENRDEEPWYGIGQAAEYANQPPRDFEDMPPDPEAGLARESLNSLKMSLTSSTGDHGARRPRPRRQQHLPWFLRSAHVYCFAVGGTMLLAALIGLCFMRGAAWMRGFHPGNLAVYPGAGDFSAANFVYSFVPAVLGMLLFLPLLSLDLALRTLQPWAELNRPDGAPAKRSLLLDYAASAHPLAAAVRAARNRHWRVAGVSAVAGLGVLIPVLAGGLFMAHNDPDGGGGTNRIYPSPPVFYVLLALLILYLFAVLSVVPARGRLRLPHAVTCVADIVSFLNTEDVKRERAFQLPYARTRGLMMNQLGVFRKFDGDDKRWVFGTGSTPGKGDSDRLGVRKVRRFTEKV